MTKSVSFGSQVGGARSGPKKPQLKSSQSWWMRKLRYLYYRLLRLQGSPKAIARGVATGVFAGFFPLFGLQTIIGIFLATLFQGNKIAAAAGTWISNPLTYVPIYAFNFGIGQWILRKQDLALEPVDWASKELLELGSEFVFTLFFGCFVVGLIMSIASYFLSLPIIDRFRQNRQKFNMRKR